MYAAILLVHVLQIVLMPTEVRLHAILLKYGLQCWQQIHVVIWSVVAPDRVMSDDKLPLGSGPC